MSHVLFGGGIIHLSVLEMIEVSEVTETKAFMRRVEALCARDDRCRDLIGPYPRTDGIRCQQVPISPIRVEGNATERTLC